MVQAALFDTTPAVATRGRGVRQAKNSVTTDNPVPPTYEAAGTGRRTRGWFPPEVSPNNAILWNLTTLRNRSRAACRNNGLAKGAVDTLVSNLVGDGIVPLSKAPGGIAEQVQALWERSLAELDADGLLNAYGQQQLAVRTWVEAGEAFGRGRDRLAEDGLAVPFQVQVLEPELCPHSLDFFGDPGTSKIRGGIEFSPIGRRTAYYFHPSRPELDDFDRSQVRRVPADVVAHLYSPNRPGQLRGVPWLTQALVRLNELDKMDDTVLLRSQLANLFVGFIKRDTTSDGSEDIDILSGRKKGTGERPTLALEPGIFQELEPGESVDWSEPPGAPTGYIDYVRTQIRAIAISIGVPYEILTGEMSGSNDRTVRIALNQFKRFVAMLQYTVIVHKWCQPLWRMWFERAWLSGSIKLPADAALDLAPYMAVKWVPPRWAYLHPVQDIEADIAAVRAGFTTRADVVAEWGDDVTLIDKQQAEDQKRADQLGLVYDTDGRRSKGAGSAQPKAGGQGGQDNGGAQEGEPADPADSQDGNQEGGD